MTTLSKNMLPEIFWALNCIYKEKFGRAIKLIVKKSLIKNQN